MAFRAHKAPTRLFRLVFPDGVWCVSTARTPYTGAASSLSRCWSGVFAPLPVVYSAPSIIVSLFAFVQRHVVVMKAKKLEIRRLPWRRSNTLILDSSQCQRSNTIRRATIRGYQENRGPDLEHLRHRRFPTEPAYRRIWAGSSNYYPVSGERKSLPLGSSPGPGVAIREAAGPPAFVRAFDYPS